MARESVRGNEFEVCAATALPLPGPSWARRRDRGAQGRAQVVGAVPGALPRYREYPFSAGVSRRECDVLTVHADAWDRVDGGEHALVQLGDTRDQGESLAVVRRSVSRDRKQTRTECETHRGFHASLGRGNPSTLGLRKGVTFSGRCGFYR